MEKINERGKPCQRICHCGQPLTPDDLDGQCVKCRGNRLTLYPKTPAIGAKDAAIIMHCRMMDRKYEPSANEQSAYFWCCQKCHLRLGPAYMGDPDERGYCSKCVELDKILAKQKADEIEAAGGLESWQRKQLIELGEILAKRNADEIEAAGGLKSWQRKQFIKKFIMLIDCIAVIICGVSLLLSAPGTIAGIVIGIWEKIGVMWANLGDRVLLILIVVSVAWLVIRWKTLNLPQAFKSEIERIRIQNRL